MTVRLSRQDENLARSMGRQMAESAARNVASTTDSGGSTVYRETGRVVTVYEEGRLDINLGDDESPLLVEAVPYTTACTGVQADDTVIIETFGHRMVAVGIVATSSDPQYRPATQDKVDVVDGKADSAISKADENAADIIKAQKSVEEAASKADDAAAKAQSATDAASKAQTAADAAQASAETASSAATEAKTKADDAAAKITVIEGNITEIDAASKEAKDAADKAQTTADAANETATKANETIAETNKQVTSIADEMATVKEDAIKTRDELSEQIQTVTDTMTADYAKKTELTETEASLKTEISKSAAGVLSEVSSNYSTKVELDKVREATDAKARVFTEQPTPPYAAGDLWVQGESGEIMRCIAAKTEGEEYAEADWDKASKYTDDSSVTELANTVEKTYATQSTVEQLSDRIEQTVSAVETVKVDAAAAQKKADEATATAAAAKETADTAKANADTAQGKADDAAAAAKTAQDAADTAKADAATAQTAANNAKQAAADAQTAATAAQEKANTAAADAKTANDDLAVAKKNLEAVQSQANATDEQVAAAQAAVVKAQDAADKANEAATTAQTAATTAQTTADAAKENAAAAQTTADAAKESAATAATAAETAKTNAAAAQATADTANETANTAVTNAANAQADADKANEAIADLKDRVTTAETSIRQNAEAIELKASKTELEDGVADAKSYSDSQLAVKADEITASVETAQAGVDTLESLVRVYGEGVEVAKKVNGAYTSSKAVITDEAFSIVAQDGTELASYGKNLIKLAENSTSGGVDLCDGTCWMYKLSNSDFWIKGTKSIELRTTAAGLSYIKINGEGICLYTPDDDLPITLRCGGNSLSLTSSATYIGSAQINKLKVSTTAEVTESLTAKSVITNTITSPKEMTITANSANSNVVINNTTFGNKHISTGIVYTPSIYQNGTLSITSTGAMTIKANNASSNITLNNTVFGNNTMNTTTAAIDNLWWDSTLLGGRVGVKLWSGTLSKGGSITVSNLNRYWVLFVTVSGFSEAIPLVNRNDSIYLSASGSLDNGASTYVYCATFNKNSATGTTLKLISASKHIMDSSVAGTALNVTGIWGFI